MWLRPSHFLSADFELFNGIDPNDIKQGQLGVCYCLATISEYARTPKKIVDIFAYYDLELGFYVLRFYTDGKPNYIVVDDYFPCSSVSQQPLFSKPIGNEIWVLLIEKAWAKVIGSYFAAEMMTPDLFMEDLTGSPTYGSWFKDKKDKMRDVVSYSSKGYLIVLTTGSKRIQGIVNNHAYSLLKVIEHEGAFIYKLRNPWGRFEWNGCYGEQSTLWTPELRSKCEEVGGDDGIFFLS
jgi:calpain-15